MHYQQLFRNILFPYKAQKNMESSFQKLRILKISRDNRIEEFPNLAKTFEGETNGDHAPPILPRPAQLTGTFYLKLHGVEGLLDLYTLRQAAMDVDSNQGNMVRAYSTSQTVKNTARNFMTLPNPKHGDKEREREKEREKERAMASDDEISGPGGSGGSGGTNTWYRRGSKHGRNKNTAMQKQHSLDHIDDASSKHELGFWLLR